MSGLPALSISWKKASIACFAALVGGVVDAVGHLRSFAWSASLSIDGIDGLGRAPRSRKVTVKMSKEYETLGVLRGVCGCPAGGGCPLGLFWPEK